MEQTEIEKIIEKTARLITWDKASGEELNMPKNSCGVLNTKELAKALTQYVIKVRIEELSRLRFNQVKSPIRVLERIAELKKGLEQ